MANDANIYCDESRHSNADDPYLVIGAVKCLRDRKSEIADALNGIKRENPLLQFVGDLEPVRLEWIRGLDHRTRTRWRAAAFS